MDEVEIERLISRVHLLRDALNEIIAASHDWQITKATGAILAPVHAKYRAIAKSAIKKDDYIRSKL
jgi:hypothetical protein